jgi:hypothetical protein
MRIRATLVLTMSGRSAFLTASAVAAHAADVAWIRRRAWRGMPAPGGSRADGQVAVVNGS